MALETSTYINGLVGTNPVDSTDQVASLGGHVRLLKNAIKATFPNISGAANPTHQELNHLVGVTSGVQAQLDAKATPASLAAAVSAHEAAADPHPGYVTTAEGAALITAHKAESDPHPTYLTAAELPAELPAALNSSGSAPVYGCRAWGNFNGNTGSLRAGGNASIARNSKGKYTVTFATAMPDANYSVVISKSFPTDTDDGTGDGMALYIHSLTAGSFKIWSERNVGGVEDGFYVTFAVFR